ncbi:MAG TPA: SPOR domain-containing protein [Paucimonas sp.]|nr:SPOR domain-containing protein [Paucimonas sp.]
MLKIVFALLLLANAALFAYHQGYLSAGPAEVREPGRMTRQLNADRIQLLPAAAADAPPASVAEVAACTEIGSFDAEEAKRFDARIAALALGERVTQRAIDEPSRHIVFIPPQGNKEGADKKAGELKKLGVKDFYVIQDAGELKWGISLGIFRTEEAARAHLTALNQKGVRSARLAPYAAAPSKVAYRLRDLDAAARAELDKIKADFPQQEIRGCEAA